MPPFDSRALEAGVDLIAEPVERRRYHHEIFRDALRLQSAQWRSEVILPTRPVEAPAR
jgi:hypothetical protein